jgi:hypothetical protein
MRVARHGPPLSFALSHAQMARVEAIAATLPNDTLRNDLYVQTGAKLRHCAPVGALSDALLDSCLDAPLEELKVKS